MLLCLVGASLVRLVGFQNGLVSGPMLLLYLNWLVQNSLVVAAMAVAFAFKVVESTDIVMLLSGYN